MLKHVGLFAGIDGFGLGLGASGVETIAHSGAGDMWACKCSDGPRYRAIGNAVTVNVVEWWGHRMVALL